MNKIILSGSFDHLSAMIKKAKKSFLIVSPFFSKKMVSHVCSLVEDRNLDCFFLTLPPGKEYLMGSCDYSALKDLEKASFELRLIDKLHAKLYVIDERKVLIGSANLTESGLSVSSSHVDKGTVEGNIEAMTGLTISEGEYNKIISIWNDAIPYQYDQKMHNLINGQKDKILHSNIGELSTVIIDAFRNENPYSRLLKSMKLNKIITHYERIQKGFGRNAFTINHEKQIKIHLSTDRKVKDGAVYYSYTLSNYVKKLLTQLNGIVLLFEEPDSFAWIPKSIMKEEVLTSECKKAGDVWQFQVIRKEDKTTTTLKIRSKNNLTGRWTTKEIDITRYTGQIIQRLNPLDIKITPKPSKRKGKTTG